MATVIGKIQESVTLEVREDIYEQSNEDTNEDTNEEGSISPLISLYFVILMLAIFLLSNISSAYVDRRELINLTEAALAASSQELDKLRYYYQLPTPSWLDNPLGKAVPIDCSNAASVFQREIELSSQTYAAKSDSRDKNSESINKEFMSKIKILDFQCDGKNLRARVMREQELMFAPPVFGLETFTNEVEVGISTRYQR